MRLPALAALALGSLLALYPLAVWQGLSRGVPAAWMAAGLAGLLLLRWGATLRRRLGLGGLLGVLVAVGLLVGWKAEGSLRFYPVLVNAVLLTLFGLSLRFGPSAVERLARLREPNLDERGVRYTRRVTQVWCVFFALNGAAALATALWADARTWALYNGGLAYLLMGLLGVGEWLLRRRLLARTARP
jgi:uncharacterized membrane protein